MSPHQISGLHALVAGQCHGTSVLAEMGRAAFRELLRVLSVQTLSLCPACLLQSLGQPFPQLFRQGRRGSEALNHLPWQHSDWVGGARPRAQALTGPLCLPRRGVPGGCSVSAQLLVFTAYTQVGVIKASPTQDWARALSGGLTLSRHWAPRLVELPTCSC